ncbi:FtsW/RodA/SpoVE family cell cycle protein [Clostridiaceae bacterium 35-E11]
MNKYVSEFLKEVCHQIKYKKIHSDISKELLVHIDEIKDEYITKGMTEDEATRKAVEQMGNPTEIGKNLNKTHKPKTEWSIVMLISIMVLAGGGVLFSIASDTASSISMGQFIKAYLVYTLLGISICVACYFFDYTKLEKYSLHIFGVTIAFLFVSQWSPNTVNGSHQIIIGAISFNPVSTVIPFLLISFSGLLTKWGTGNVKDMLKLLSLAVLAIAMCLTQPSIASAITLGCGFSVILTIAIMNKNFKGNRKRFLSFIYGSGISGAAGFLLFSMLRNPYRFYRLRAFLNPKQDPTGAGYLYVVSQKILSGARLFGKGDGLYINNQNAGDGFILPMINSEFIFTYIVSAFGWIAGIAVMLIITLTMIRMFLAIRRIRSTYGKYIACSIATVFSLQMVENILMNLGLFPIIGVSLPLISYGGTNFVTNMSLIGLILGVYRRKDLILENSR